LAPDFDAEPSAGFLDDDFDLPAADKSDGNVVAFYNKHGT
jgi:hypothetical protein